MHGFFLFETPNEQDVTSLAIVRSCLPHSLLDAPLAALLCSTFADRECWGDDNHSLL